MSYDIEYQRIAFKTGNKFVVMVKRGCNNVSSYNCITGRWGRSQDWKIDYIGTEEEILSKIDDNENMVEGGSIQNKSGRMTFKGYKRSYEKTLKNALNILTFKQFFETIHVFKEGEEAGTTEIKNLLDKNLVWGYNEEEKTSYRINEDWDFEATKKAWNI